MFKRLAGSYRKKDLEKLLEKFCADTKSEYIKDVTISFGEDSSKVPYLVIGKFGVMLIDGIDYLGDLYGSIDDKNWALHEKDYKTPVNNPVKEQKKQVSILRRIFPKEDIYRIEIGKFVVFLENPKKLVFYSSVKNCVYFKEMKKHLSSDEYKKDNKVDIKKVKESILKFSTN